jgi:hypothetical protein
MKALKALLLIATVTLVAAACSKSIKISKQLDGTWKIVEYKENGTSVDIDSFGLNTYRISFESCKVTKEDCPGESSWEFGGVTLTEDFTYTINDEGTEITITWTDSGDTETATILEHSKTHLVLEDEDGGDVYEIHYEKI